MSGRMPEWMEELVGFLRVEPGRKVMLAKDFDPGYTAGFVQNKKEGARLLEKTVGLLADYQVRLAAQNRDAVLLCLQALDAGGKDSTIRHVMSGVNPQGVHVSSFKEPTSEELRHDYLWRYAKRLPGQGEIGIFNRSHYEEVLVVRVHPALLEHQGLSSRAKGSTLWRQRFAEINGWEHYVRDSGIRVLKVFLHISKDEQRRRFLRRLDLPDHHWKFAASDVRERQFWDDYQHAYSDVLSFTSTEWAPWYVVPADHKWFARICVSALLVHTLMEIGPRFPKITPAQQREERDARAALVAERPEGAAPAS
jgi:PPK2 family polyphosphate:nucleotide phosphotransferase